MKQIRTIIQNRTDAFKLVSQHTIPLLSTLSSLQWNKRPVQIPGQCYSSIFNRSAEPHRDMYQFLWRVLWHTTLPSLFSPLVFPTARKVIVWCFQKDAKVISGRETICMKRDTRENDLREICLFATRCTERDNAEMFQMANLPFSLRRKQFRRREINCALCRHTMRHSEALDGSTLTIRAYQVG